MDDAIDAVQKARSEITSQTSETWEFIKSKLTFDTLFNLICAVVVLCIFFGLYRLARHILRQIPEDKLKKNTSAIIERVIKYVFYLSCIMYILSLFGVKLTAIWGAAGVAGVAIGFAAQTSVSNIISGVFVLSEKSLKIGDLITVGDVTGIVDEIHLLSVQIHTLDNQMVRIPNSNIINTNLINTSYHPIRRMTISVSVDYNTDLRLALDTLSHACDNCPTVLKDPEPAAWLNGFGDSGIELVLAVWFNKDDFRDTKNAAFIAIYESFNNAGITIPYNRMNVCIVKDPAVEALALGKPAKDV